MSRGAFLTITDPPGMLAGCVYVELREGGTHCYFGMLSVHPARQGQGLARRLVAAVEEYGRVTGCTHVDLHVLSQRAELPDLKAETIEEVKEQFETSFGKGAVSIVPHPGKKAASVEVVTPNGTFEGVIVCPCG